MIITFAMDQEEELGDVKTSPFKAKETNEKETHNGGQRQEG
jgi:hypothetical protein